jgi:hypothetical protein
MKRIEHETSRWNQSKAYRRLSVSWMKRLEDQDRIKAKRIEDGASKMKQIEKSHCVSIHRSVIEDGIKVGGIGTRVRQDMRAAQVDTALNEIGLPDEFLEHASRAQIMERVGLTAQAIARDIVAQVVGSRVPHARPLIQADEAIRSQETQK